jgi:hypothetical protein
MSRDAPHREVGVGTALPQAHHSTLKDLTSFPSSLDDTSVNPHQVSWAQLWQFIFALQLLLLHGFHQVHHSHAPSSVIAPYYSTINS